MLTLGPVFVQLAEYVARPLLVGLVVMVICDTRCKECGATAGWRGPNPHKSLRFGSRLPA